MIDISTARALVEKELSKQSLNQSPEDELVIVDILSIEDLGWIFSYSTQRALSESQPADNEPIDIIIVDQKDGALRHTGTSKLTEKSMEEFRTKKLAYL